LVTIRVPDAFAAGHAKVRASIMQSKPVRFEIAEPRLSLERWNSDLTIDRSMGPVAQTTAVQLARTGY
jgi:hypothetical protein